MKRTSILEASRASLGVPLDTSYARTGLSLLVGIASLGIVAGCTAPAMPPAVAEADAVLERHDTKTVSAARPRLVAEARDLVRRAKEAGERGETERATLLARQAVQKFQTAKNFTEREQAERMVQALEKSGGSARRASTEDVRDGGREGAQEALARADEVRAEAARSGVRLSSLAEGDEVLRAARRAFESQAWDRARERANEARALFDAVGGRIAGGDSSSGGSFRSLAEKNLVQLSLRRGELLGQLRDQSCAAPFREFEAILELGQKRFDAGDYEHAYEFSLRADERLRVCDPKNAPPAAATKREADEEAARKKAAAALQKAQIELSRVQAQNREDPGAIQGQALLQNGDTWYARHAYAEATDLATRAYAVLSRVKAAPATASAPAGIAGAVAATSARDEAEEALAEAKLERDRTSDGPQKTRGLEQLATAERSFGTRAYAEAKAGAKRATEAFRASAKETACADAKVRADRARELDKKLPSSLSAEKDKLRKNALAEIAAADKKREERACVEAATLAEHGRKTLAELAGEPKSTPSGADRPWEAALLAIHDAEKAKEGAVARGDKSALERGDVALKTANLAYAREELGEAESAAREAEKIYTQVRDGAGGDALRRAEAFAADRLAKLGPLQGVDPEWRAAYLDTIRALALTDDANRESPHEREKLERAAQLISASRAAWDRKAYAEAQKKASEAQVILAPLASPSADTGTPEELERMRRGVEARVRETEDLAAICEKARCGERDAPRAAEAKAIAGQAKSALDRRHYRAAGELAEAAKSRYELALKSPLHGAKAPTTDPETRKRLTEEAESALRDAGVAKRACETRSCEASAANKARDAYVAARVAFADAKLEAARDSAREAESAYRAAVVPLFEIPAQAREVARDGDRLVFAPAITWKPQSTELAATAEPSIAALARTLVDNGRALRRVKLVVPIERGGYAPQTKKIAEGRAEKVRVALVGRGVPSELVAVEIVQSPEAPAPGGAALDVRLVLAEGVK